MPIILIAVESENVNLSDFDSMKDIVVDFVLESTDPRSKAIGDFLSTKMVFVNRLAMDILNESGEDPAKRMQVAIDTVRQMKVRSAIIIGHHSVFNSWNPAAIKDEWDVIDM
jgi:hypothetical protein